MGQKYGGWVGGFSLGFRSLMRRKQVDNDSVHVRKQQLAKELSALQLIAIGVGSTIGAGVYVLVGTVAREHSGPSLTISFLIAGIAAALSAFCYAELASRCPSAGSAYHYSYICVGEGVAWLIGWALILEYTIGGAAVARGISPNLTLFFGGKDGLPAFLGRFYVPSLDIVADPCAAILVFIVIGLLCTGIKEVKNPRRDLPLGIGVALFICCLLYMLVSVVIVGLVPYYAMDPDTPISSAFSSHGMHWAGYVITAGAVMALCSTLMGSMLPQPRVLMAMGRDGLLPPFFSDVNSTTQVPIKSTLVTGLFAASLALCMDVSQLAGMVSVGTLLAFTIVAVSILILRYIPPDEMPLPLSLQPSFDPATSQYDAQENKGEESRDGYRTCSDVNKQLQGCMLDPNDVEASTSCPLIMKENTHEESKERKRRRVAALNITVVCIGVLLLTSAASAEFMTTPVRLSVCIVGGSLLLCSLIVLSWIDQDDGQHRFGHTGGFMCPFVPLLPVACILINVYLLINLSTGTWIRVSVWLLIGVFVYLFYGRAHSSLAGAIYVPTAHAEEIYRSSSHSLA